MRINEVTRGYIFFSKPYLMFQPIIHNSYPWNNFVGVDGTLILRGTDDEDEFVEDGEEITGIDFCKVIYSLYIR